MEPTTGKPKLKHELGLLDGTMLVAGSMIGSGIFIVSADITRNVGSAGWLIAVWLITGFMTITAAVSYGELSGMFPSATGTLALDVGRRDHGAFHGARLALLGATGEMPISRGEGVESRAWFFSLGLTLTLGIGAE